MSEIDARVVGIARRYHEYKKLKLPVDVEALLREKAEVQFIDMPFQIDGFCIDLKVPGRTPKVFVNSRFPRTRQRFTMAHELGHVVIPWHIGTITDNIDFDLDQEIKHITIEEEANGFASELLMPEIYITSLVNNEFSLEKILQSVEHDCDVSIPAAFFRVKGFLQKNVFVIYEDGFSKKLIEFRSLGTQFSIGHFSSIEEASLAHFNNGEVEAFQLRSYRFVCWRFPTTLTPPSSDEVREWRPLLDMVVGKEISDVDIAHKIKHRINAVVSNINSRNRDCFDEDFLFAEAINRFSADDDYRSFAGSSEFHEFLLLRIRDLMKRRSQR